MTDILAIHTLRWGASRWLHYGTSKSPGFQHHQYAPAVHSSGCRCKHRSAECCRGSPAAGGSLPRQNASLRRCRRFSPVTAAGWFTDATSQRIVAEDHLSARLVTVPRLADDIRQAMPELLTDREGQKAWEGINSPWGKLLRETSQRVPVVEQNLRMQGQYLDRD